jgi:hypothetical protein
MEPICIDLCALLLNAPKWHLALRVLQEDGHEILAISFLERNLTKRLLRQLGLLEHFDDICYGFVPFGPRLKEPWQVFSHIRNSRYITETLDLKRTLQQGDNHVPYEEFPHGEEENGNGPPQ